MIPNKKRPDSRMLGGAENLGDIDRTSRLKITALAHSPQVVECSSRHDSIWFAKRPGKQFRFRPARRGEIPGASTGDWIVVRQLAPGARVRLAVQMLGTRKEISKHAPTGDKALALLWGACSTGKAFGMQHGRVLAGGANGR